jgi:NCAIR mutase (PurE)-related protein
MNEKFTNLDELEDRIDRIKIQWDSSKRVLGENPAMDVHLESAKQILEDVRKDFERLTAASYPTVVNCPAYSAMQNIEIFKQIADTSQELRLLKEAMSIIRKTFTNLDKEIDKQCAR